MRICSYAQEGYKGHIVTVEVDVHRGLPGLTIVGLAGNAVKEAKDRVRVALMNSGYEYPYDRIVVNLAPGNLPKRGSNYDLAIAYALLLKTKQIPPCASSAILLLGELYLDGTIEAVPAIVSAVDESLKDDIHDFVVPTKNYYEASILQRGNVIPISSLQELKYMQNNHTDKKTYTIPSKKYPHIVNITHQQSEIYNFDTLHGIEYVKRALEIAAAGGHHVFVVGPPGCGKTLATKCLPSILPALNMTEAIEVTRIYSLLDISAGHDRLITTAPFRVPHHSISYAGMVGGGPHVTPGEIVLAHNGILLLDEVLEFRRDVLQTLRQPLEDQEVHIIRAERALKFPCSFQLLMTANACPCANLGRNGAVCFCKYDEIRKYWRRLGGAFLDRVPIRIPIMGTQTKNRKYTYTNSEMKERVKRAINIQKKRYAGTGIRRNGALRAGLIAMYCPLTGELTAYMEEYAMAHSLSMRSQNLIRTVARTIADLNGDEQLNKCHLTEAIHLRTLTSTLPKRSPLAEIDTLID